MKHPAPTVLALYAGGELSLLRRWLASLHLARCAECRREVEEFREARQLLRSTASELPAGLDWERLAEEMTANIHLGLAAGECISRVHKSVKKHRARTAVLAVPLAIALVAAILYQLSRPRLYAPAPQADVLLEASSGSLQLRDGHRALTLQHPEALAVTYMVSSEGTVGARYIDSETGMITIQNVYAE